MSSPDTDVRGLGFLKSKYPRLSLSKENIIQEETSEKNLRLPPPPVLCTGSAGCGVLAQSWFTVASAVKSYRKTHIEVFQSDTPASTSWQRRHSRTSGMLPLLTFVSSTISAMTDDQLPRPGEIWNACVSVRRGALLAAQMYSAAKLSQSMQQDLQDFLNLQVHGRDRPCIVFSVKQNTVQIFPITRLEGRPRHSVNGHIEHFLVPFGDDEVGNDSQTVIKTTPDWPTSKITPSYVFGYAIDVPIAAIHHKHLRGIEGQTFDVEPDELDKLQHVADAKLTSYKLIPRATMQEYNASWTARVKLPWRALDGLSGPASAPPEPLSAARPVRTICMPRLMRGVHVVNYPLFTYPPTIWESQTAAAHPSRSSANCDLGIDQEASDQFPALRSADPAASGHPSRECRVAARGDSLW
ncbi:hypothetical protein EXIGLDRAFT_702199 [Exidia glandulosa HHB12029]|uniref:Uncharacterized protein n=1 Tax=Exidia glandulosa HHB12029 TaxID=1314781 RepID=A0A165CNL9_EXIGL|nr:hypothetical protein EXIGLDRAFT_702199 [Exidia glandulosa HHB12029]